MIAPAVQDWTTGGEGIVAYHCEDCSQSFYFWREFCPGCGSIAVNTRQSAGAGTIVARTTLNRAPTRELKVCLPYTIVTVQLDDGFCVMGHGSPELQIGQRAIARFKRVYDQQLVPFFTEEEA